MRVRIILLFIFVMAGSTSYSQLTFDALVNSFEGFENDEFHQYLINNDFEMRSASPDSTIENYHLGYDAVTKKSQIILQKNTFPGNSLWIVTYGNPIYDNLVDEIKKNCNYEGSFGTLSIRAWEGYKHSSGIEFRLVQFRDSKEKGHFIIEVLERH